MTRPTVQHIMSLENSLGARFTARDPGAITAPHASDLLAGAFRTAFDASDELPDDFRAILALLDHAERGTH